jgi:hypothetical protein
MWTGEGEVEVEVLRIAVVRETWQCLAEDESPSCVADTSSEAFPALSSQPRNSPRELRGLWNVFDVTAVPLPDDAASGARTFTHMAKFCNLVQILNFGVCDARLAVVLSGTC